MRNVSVSQSTSSYYTADNFNRLLAHRALTITKDSMRRYIYTNTMQKLEVDCEMDTVTNLSDKLGKLC